MSSASKFTTLFRRKLSRKDELDTPIIAKCRKNQICLKTGDAIAAKLMVEMMSGPLEGEDIPAWDMIHIFAATDMSHEADGWCIFNFDAFGGKPATFHWDCPKGNFKFRFVAEFYVMRERGEDEREVSVKDNGKVIHVGSCAGPTIEVTE